MESLLNALTIAVEVEAAVDVKRALFDRLFQSNAERTGDGRIEYLCVVARDSGLGTQLLARMEGEALAKGSHGAYLDTFTFQSLGLYTRAGYEIFGTLEQFPNGHSRYFLRKLLHAA
jgi:L-amino acid N-acyltransferase YncA